MTTRPQWGERWPGDWRPEPGRRMYTVDDYMALEWRENERYELLDGELVLTPAPGRKHQVIAVRLAAVLEPYTRRNGLGQLLLAPFDVVLSRRTVCQPDLVFISRARLDALDAQNLKGPPDLAVEILSREPGRDLIRKRSIYERAGVANVWFVDPERRTVEELVLEEGAYRMVARLEATRAEFRPAVFPGLSIDLADLFAEL